VAVLAGILLDSKPITADKYGRTQGITIDWGGPNVLWQPLTPSEYAAICSAMGVADLSKLIGQKVILDGSRGAWTLAEDKSVA